MEILKQNHVRYALLMCGVLAACLAYMELSGQNESFDKSPLVAVWTFVAPFVIWFLGIRAKKKSQKGKLTFREGVKEGYKISLAFGILSPFLFAIYYLLVNPGIIEYLKTSYAFVGNLNNTTAILVDMVAQLLSATVFGTVYGAIISFFLKSK